MLRQPLRTKRPPGVQRSLTFTLPSPVGGWNARDSVAEMPALDAFTLENWIPGTTQCTVRGGASDWKTGFANAPLTVFPYNSASTSKLFAAASNGIFDCTTAGAIGASVLAITNGLLETTNIQTPGGSFLVGVNGVDKLVLYDGTTWKFIDGASTPAITGQPTTSLRNVAVMVNRVWFSLTGSSSAWYLPLSSVGGALVEFPLGQVFTKGGSLVAMSPWTLDGGNGPDDYSIFISSEGQVAVYAGTDPSSATTWQKVGVFDIGRPLGKRCLVKYGGDVLYLSDNGLFPISKALQSASINRVQSISSKVDRAFINSAQSAQAGGLSGWQAVVYPQGGLLIVNVPVTSSQLDQYVMNTVTSAWCKFTGWNCTSFCIFGGAFYFTSPRGVALGLADSTDFGANIAPTAVQAFNTLRYPAQNKQVKLVRPLFSLSGDQDYFLSIATDYSLPDATDASRSTLYTEGLGGLWESASTSGANVWDDAEWAPGDVTVQQWASGFSFPCVAAAPILQMVSPSSNLSWSATNFVYELAGVL